MRLTGGVSPLEGEGRKREWLGKGQGLVWAWGSGEGLVCVPVRDVLGGAGREGGVLSQSRPKTQEQRLKSFPLSQDGHYAAVHSRELLRPVCGHQTSGHCSLVL